MALCQHVPLCHIRYLTQGTLSLIPTNMVLEREAKLNVFDLTAVNDAVSK